MALALLSRSYGSSNAGNKVVIRDTITSAPARLYATAKGGLISQDGSYILPSTGELALYVDDRKQYAITLFNTQYNTEVSNEQGVDAGSIQAPVSGVGNEASDPIPLAGGA